MNLQFTESAVEKIFTLRQKEGKPEASLRFGVKAGGCSGLSYLMDFVEESPLDNDRVLEFHGLKVFVDPKSALYLHEIEVDYVDTLKEVGFQFNNPNATRSCACGESFSV